ncbi:MAG TPA: hypothetical protein VHB20_07475 [Verrucomicrobiae bacterium]|jgi:hypothetical protein|nr:hypothetical protein [Verrucomicrobiae bacterium]
MSAAPQLDLFRMDPKSPNCAFLVELLKGQDWRTAAELLKAIGHDDTESGRRSLRAVAEASEGRIAGGQKGYKLVDEMTIEEFKHYRDWMLSQARKMESRVIQADKVFYSRQPVPV